MLRAAAFAQVGLIVALMPFVFINVFYDVSEFMFMIADRSPMESAAALILKFVFMAAALWSLDLTRDRTSFWPAIGLYMFAVVPNVGLSVVTTGLSLGETVEVDAAVVTCFIGIIFVLSRFEDVVLRIRERSARNAAILGKTSALSMGRRAAILKFDWVMIGVAVVGLVATAIAIGFNLDASSALDQFYSVRLELRDQSLGFYGYLLAWLVVLFSCIVYPPLAQHKGGLVVAAVASIGAALVIVLTSAQKVGLFYAVLPIAYYLMRYRPHEQKVFLAVTAVMFSVIVLPLADQMLFTEPGILAFFSHRVFFTPGELHGLAIELFTDLPKLEFVDVLSRLAGTPSVERYTFLLGGLTGQNFDANANVSFLTDGFVNAGVGGMVIVSIITAVTLCIVLFLTIVSGSETGELFLFICAFAYAGTAFQQIYLTNGVVPIVVLLLLRWAVQGGVVTWAVHGGRTAVSFDSESAAR